MEKILKLTSEFPDYKFDAVNSFVEQLLSDPTVNIGFVPDMIERPLARKMMLTILCLDGREYKYF